MAAEAEAISLVVSGVSIVTAPSISKRSICCSVIKVPPGNQNRRESRVESFPRFARVGWILR